VSQSISSTGSTAGTNSGSNPASQTALSSLTDNYQSFLQMLLTQLQNQDPTSPMDSSQFTSELVQFAGVEQQINTNSSLTQLLQLTQDNTTVQSTQLVGKQVQVTSSQLSLQNGTAGVDFTAPSGEPVTVTVSNSSGTQLYTTTTTAIQGSNSWTWNGKTSSGVTAPDGAYSVSVVANAGDGSTSALPFTVVGKVTGVTTNGAVVTVSLGGLSVNMTAVTSVGN
jgi:flagellar basal-body rod modification protein FlgD